MQSVFEAIKQFPTEFIITARARAKTSPSYSNIANHLKLADAIESENWDTVRAVITDPNYARAFEGVVNTLGHYADIHHKDQYTIMMLLADNFIV